MLESLPSGDYIPLFCIKYTCNVGFWAFKAIHVGYFHLLTMSISNKQFKQRLNKLDVVRFLEIQSTLGYLIKTSL